MAALPKPVRRVTDQGTVRETPPSAGEFRELPTIPLPKLSVITPGETPAEAPPRSNQPGAEPPA